MDVAEQSRKGIILELAMELLRSSGELRSVVRGSSMLPTIFPGDILIVRSEAAKNARLGDILLFYRQGYYCAHRLVEKLEEEGCLSFVTRGDSLAKADPPISENELLGRAVAVIRGWKHIELRNQTSAAGSLLQWVLRRSEFTVKWILRLHYLRTRLTRDPDGVLPDAASNPLVSVG